MLTVRHKQQLQQEGWTRVRGLVPEVRSRAARERIARSLERDRRLGVMDRSLASTFCPDALGSSAILDLFYQQEIQQAIGEIFGSDARWHIGPPQIALRFPQTEGTGAEDRFHLDGFPTGLNGVPAGRLTRHTLTVGVFLNRLESPDRGNFVVWPGSHRWFERFFEQLPVERWLCEQGPEAVLKEVQSQDPGTDPVQVCVEPGDVVFAHHLLAHAGADNLSLQVRQAVYFRVRHVLDDPADPAPLCDAGRFFEGLGA